MSDRQFELMRQNFRISTADAIKQAAAFLADGRTAKAQAICEAVLKLQPENVTALNFLGGIKIQLCEFKSAIPHLERAKKLRPKSPDIRNNLGIAYQKLGKLDLAKMELAQAIQLSPSSERAHSSLSNLLSEMGEYDAAIAHAKKAVNLSPKSVKAHDGLALACIAKSDLDDAEQHLKASLKIDPNNVMALYNMSEVLLRTGRSEEALEWAGRAETLAPDAPDVLYNKGLALGQLDRPREALACLKKALESKPSYTKALSARSTVLRGIRDLDLAKSILSEMIISEPETTEFLIERGNVYIALNNKEAAEADFLCALKIDEYDIGALVGLGKLKKYTEDDPRVSTVKALSTNTELSLGQKFNVNFEVAKVYEDLGRTEEMFEYLSKANLQKREFSGYRFENDKTRFARVKQSYAAIKKSDPVMPQANRDQRNIFIVGMPRSGTTLTEQILSAHSKVYGAGELPFIKRMLSPSIDGGVKVIQASDLDRIANCYRDLLAKIAGNKQIIIDKMPHNFMYIGIILKALPTAKIINLNRDPRAVCWSIYKRNFQSFEHGYAHIHEDLARYYRLYLDLMDYWREECPGAIYDLDYRTLTEDQERQSREILEFCEIEWEDACLNFHKNKRGVMTASQSQVRRKMYTGSSNAWRMYETQLSDLIASLDKHGVPFSNR